MPSPMSRLASKPHALTKSQARRIWLRAQRLDTRAPFGDGPEATRAAVEHLGYVQIDTINVIERCHHHILYTRIPEYRREHLRQAQSVDKTVFEYWTHALSYVPTRDMRFFIGAMKRYRQSPQRWFSSVKKQELRKVLALIRKQGALTIRDIDDDVLVEKDASLGEPKAIEAGAAAGVLHRRRDHQRAGRHAQDLRADGPALRVGTAASAGLGEGDRRISARPGAAIAGAREPQFRLPSRRQAQAGHPAVDRSKGAPQAVGADCARGGGKVEHWARPEVLEAVSEPADRLVHILSPFDPLIIQRKRLQLFFDYEHRFEAYVPKESACSATLPCPCSWMTRSSPPSTSRRIARSRKLLVQKWTWVGAGPRRSHKRRIEEELHRFERFQLAS